MDKDEYGEIINGENTYKEIARVLKFVGTCLIGWTEELGGHYDILFVNKTIVYGTNIQRGIKATDLFVSIMGKGAFGFKTESKKYSDYIAEKLNLSDDETAEKLAVLINGVIERLGE